MSLSERLWAHKRESEQLEALRHWPAPIIVPQALYRAIGRSRPDLLRHVPPQCLPERP